MPLMMIIITMTMMMLMVVVVVSSSMFLTTKAWSVQIADRTLHISRVELEVIDATLAGPMRFAIVAEAARAEFELEYFQREETWDYRFVRRGDEAVRIIHADAAVPAEEFFSENPPQIWFAGGAMLEGDEYTSLKAVLPPYDRQRIATWDWTGVDITKESQDIAKDADSVQAAVIRTLMREDYQVAGAEIWSCRVSATFGLDRRSLIP